MALKTVVKAKTRQEAGAMDFWNSLGVPDPERDSQKIAKVVTIKTIEYWLFGVKPPTDKNILMPCAMGYYQGFSAGIEFYNEAQKEGYDFADKKEEVELDNAGGSRN